MACLAVYRAMEGLKGHFVAVANPVYVTSPIEAEGSSEVIFEVFEQAGIALKNLVGKIQYFRMGDQQFWAELKTLDPCESTHPGLALLRNRKTLRGVLRVMEEAGQIH